MWGLINTDVFPSPTSSCRHLQVAVVWRHPVCENGSGFERFIHKCDLFYQDRLGTNVGKALKKENAVFLHAEWQEGLLSWNGHALSIFGHLGVDPTTGDLPVPERERRIAEYRYGNVFVAPLVY